MSSWETVLAILGLAVITVGPRGFFLYPERELPMPPERLVCVIHALTEGLVFQRLLTPELVPDQVFYDAFAALAVPRRS